MSETTRINLTKVGSVIAAMLALANLVKGWPGLPERVEKLETQMRSIEQTSARVDERTARMEKTLDKLAK